MKGEDTGLAKLARKVQQLSLIHIYLIGCSDDETTESVSMSADARRVMYVAMTRAARYLRVLYDGKTPRFMKEAGLTPLTAT